MAPENPQLKLDPYQSQVPLVQIPTQDLQPGGVLPLQAGYMGKTGSIASVIDQGLKGFMRGREVKEKRKAERANYAIDLSNKNEQSAWQTYQDSLRTGRAKPGDVNDPAYQAYLKAHQSTSETMQKAAIPEEKPKGQKKKDQGKDKPQEGPLKPKSFLDGIKQFAEANPHFIPQALIDARTPNQPVMTADTEETKNRLTQQGQDIKIGQQTIASNEQKMKEQAAELQRQQQQREVEEKGGYQKVIDDPKATPEQKQTALRMRSEYLDSAGPDAQAKFKYDQDLQNGNFKNWTQGDRLRASALGVVPAPKEITVERGNKAYLEYIDPITNKPIPGSVPLYVGPSSEAQAVAGFFAERSARKNDLRKAIAGDPAQYGVTLTGDKKTDEARIDATMERLFTDHEEGIRSASSALGRSAYEMERDNTILQDAWKSIASKIGNKDGDKTPFKWPGQKDPVSLSKQDANDILNQFITTPTGDHPGVYTFRDAPQLQTGKDAGAAERDRQWAYQLIKDRMMAQKGKNALTAQQADAILKGTALGKPITPDEVITQPPQPRGKFREWWGHEMEPWKDWGKSDSDTGSMRDGPPTSTPAGSKIYVINGQAYPLTPQEVEKVKAAGYTVEEAPPDLVQQFAQ